MNCQFCEDYEWSKKHRPKTGRELYTCLLYTSDAADE